MKPVLIVFILAFALFSSRAEAQTFKEIGSAELKKMLDSGAKVTVVDVRTKAEYYQGHLPKSINVEPEKYAFIADSLPKDKKKLLVFYCRGYG